MYDLKDFINEIIKKSTAGEKVNVPSIIGFLQDNDWFGSKPIFKNGKVEISTEQAVLFSSGLKLFISTPEEESNSVYLLDILSEKFPITVKRLEEFFNSEGLIQNDRFYIADFLLYTLSKELPLYDDREIEVLLKKASFDLLKFHGDLLAFFLAWLRTKIKTRFVRDYIMEKRYTMDIQNEAYSLDEYTQLLYYLFTDSYIEDNDMYSKAAESKNYTDTWLYLCIHFVCPLRLTDLQRIYHPDLHYPPEIIIQKIAEGSFSDNDGRLVLLSISQRLCMLPLNPNKTAGTTGLNSIKLNIPLNCEGHFGKLFALAEAHRQINGTPDEPLIRKVSSYSEISRYMGEEIGSLFIESDFRSRSATKSYLQSIMMIADEIFDEDTSNPRVKGYILASIARNHKGSYGELAETTATYLKDAKFNGLTPELIAYELLERGVFSFIPSMLLKMTMADSYDKASVQNQTALIKALNVSAKEIESIIIACNKAKTKAEIAVKEAINSGVDILTILHRIGCGEAVSKQPECLCLMTAIGKFCPMSTRRQCVGCEYEISTKSTLHLLIGEFNRLYLLYNKQTDRIEKNKYRHIITSVILPAINEMLTCIKENYGEAAYYQYEEFIKENTYES